MKNEYLYVKIFVVRPSKYPSTAVMTSLVDEKPFSRRNILCLITDGNRMGV